jgi:hypothetical protein
MVVLHEITSCDSYTIPVQELLVSQNSSERGACGVVLTGKPEIELKSGALSGSPTTDEVSVRGTGQKGPMV